MVEAFCGLDPPEQDSVRAAHGPAHDVREALRAIGEEAVKAAGEFEGGSVPGRYAPEPTRCRVVAAFVGLDLGEPDRDPGLAKV